MSCLKRTDLGWTLYILECRDRTFYTGITNDLESRLEAHLKGSGAKYMRGRAPFKVVYTEAHRTRSRAQKREAEIKSFSRAQKRELLLAEKR